MHQTRDLVPGQALASEISQATRARLGALTQYDGGGNVFAKPLVRDGESSGVDHLRMSEQDLLDFGGGNLLPAPIDDVLDADDNEEVYIQVQVDRKSKRMNSSHLGRS